jgi:hypothetical protein
MENFHKGPDVSDATKVGEPTLVDPKQVSAPDMVRAADTSIMVSLSGSNKVGVERVENGAAPAANAPAPRSDAEGAAPAGSDNSAVPEMKNDLQPAATTPPPGTTAPPFGQVNDAAAASSGSGGSTQAAAGSGSAQQSAPPADSNKESSSKKKKKKHLWPF